MAEELTELEQEFADALKAVGDVFAKATTKIKRLGQDFEDMKDGIRGTYHRCEKCTRMHMIDMVCPYCGHNSRGM